MKDKKQFTVALCGNPNCGKTTLFNLLTGSNQKVGNWPGVTVERKSGVCKFDENLLVTDTPGIYSLMPYTTDEKVACDFLIDGNPDLILNVVDSNSLQRSLFLTTQLAELNVPVVVALNMSDEASAQGIETDATTLNKEFGLPFVKISAAQNEGIEKLIKICTQTAKKFAQATEPRLHGKSIDFSPNACRLRYEKIARVLNKATVHVPTTNKIAEKRTVTQKIDSFVLNKWTAFPIFALAMTAVFYLSVGGPGGFLTKIISDVITPNIKTIASRAFAKLGSEMLRSLIVDGIIAGVMSVVSFLPQVTILSGLIALLEASGYMSRVAFITDRALRSIGLNGRSFVALLLGCGCSVPAIISARTIKNPNEKATTVTLTPLTPCSAKLAIIAFFTTNMFGGNPLVAVSFYFVSLGAIVLGGFLLKTLRRKKEEDIAFALELPVYRLPKFSNVAKQMLERAKSFLTKAGTVIFAASVLLWFLQHFNCQFQPTDNQDSILAAIGKAIAPLFYPLGFNDMGYGWQFAISTLTGLSAKETVVATLQLLLTTDSSQCISRLGAYSFVTYNLLTAPCAAAISASFSEQGIKDGIISLVFQLALSYTISLAIYQIGNTYFCNSKLFATITVSLTILFLTVAALTFAIRNNTRCDNCNACKSAKRPHCHK